MDCVNYLSLVLALALAGLVQSKMCDLGDVDCLTKGAEQVYKAVVAGANGLVEPFDPIRVDKIVGEALGSKYTLTNVTMTELKNCEVTKLTCNKQDLSFEFDLHCPQIILYCRDEFKGNLNGESLDGITEEKITLDDYVIIFKGKYKLSESEKDKKRRGIIKNYVIETEPKGKVTFVNLKLIRGDRKKLEGAIEYANKNWQIIEKILKTSIIDTFMKTFIDNINVYLKEFPLENVFSQE